MRTRTYSLVAPSQDDAGMKQERVINRVTPYALNAMPSYLVPHSGSLPEVFDALDSDTGASDPMLQARQKALPIEQ